MKGVLKEIERKNNKIIVKNEIYSLRLIQDGHILKWHEILGSVVRWNKVERKKVVEYFNEERGGYFQN